MLPFNYRLGAGFTVIGTVLAREHTGNLEVDLGPAGKFPPWVPLPGCGGALNSLGLPSKGVDEAVSNIGAFREMFRIPVGCPKKAFPIGVSIMGHPMDQGSAKLNGVVACVKKALPVADFIEINESCPNVKHHKGGDAELQGRLKAVVQARNEHATATGHRVPILVKLGDLADVGHTIRLLEASGVDGLVGLNTQKDYALYKSQLEPGDKALFDYYTEHHGGGMSGPLIQAKAAQQIGEAARFLQAHPEFRLRLVHVGGIQSNDDVKASRALGDRVVLREWYTGLMHAIATQPTDRVYLDAAK